MNKHRTRKLFFLLLFIVLGVTNLYARTDIKGKLEQCFNCRVSVIIDHSDFEVDKEFIPSQPDQYGNFVFELKQILRPTVVILEVNTERFPLYVEPDTQIWLTVNGANSNFFVQFDKGLVAENNHLAQWSRENGWVGDRLPNDIWFENSQVGIDASLYSNFMDQPKYLRVDFIVNYFKQMNSDLQFNLTDKLKSTYRNFIKTYVKHASSAMMYDLLIKQELTDSEKQTVTTATLSNFFNENERSNLAFIPHLKAYVEFETQHANKSKAQGFNEYFYFIWQNASQIPIQLKQEYLLHLIRNEIAPETVLNLKPTIEAFAKSLNDLDQMAILLDEYQSANTKANGRKAPNFILQNTEGRMVSLESLKGNQIYLAFWSSSCKPCIEGMKKSKSNKRLLKDENIIFLYISTDLTKQTWLGNRWVQNAGANDLHLWIGKSQPELHEYNAITLPTYYFIDEYGNFVTRFPKSWDPEFVEFVSR